MKLSKALAIKLLQLCNGIKIPASKFNHELIRELVVEGIIVDNRSGRSKSLLSVPKPEMLLKFLFNRFSINDLEKYVQYLEQEEISRAVLVQSASDSKVKGVRTFKGFLVNSYEPITATLNDADIVIDPPAGTFQFIFDFQNFIPPAEVTIVGIENAENFSQIRKQKYLFNGILPLFVSRYPQNQNKDLIKWLQKIPNQYLHFGDFDFAGINIYLNEYKCHLGNRASFFVPANLETLIVRAGSKRLYDIQKNDFKINHFNEIGILTIVELLHKYKKGLEQEILISL